MKEPSAQPLLAEDEDTIMKNFSATRKTRFRNRTVGRNYKQYPLSGQEGFVQRKGAMQSVVQIQSALDFFTTVSKKAG